MANNWLHRFLSSAALSKGGIAYRKQADVRHFSSIGDLLEEVRVRGLHLLQIGPYYVILSGNAAITIIR
jgi:hypothetical protein